MPLAGGVGDRTDSPATPAQLTKYELGVGDFLLDLQQLQVPPGTTVVQARVGIGELVVQVPDGVSVRAMASSGLGEVQVLGKQESGVANRVDTTAEALAGTAAWSSTSGSASARSGWNGELAPQSGRPAVAGRRGAVVPAGVLFLLDALDLWKLRIDYLVPLGLIVLGLGVLASAWPLRDRRRP